MSKRFITTLSAALLASVVFAHHVPVPLSSASATEILTDITFVKGSGVPTYRLSEGHSFEVPADAQFSVSDGNATHTIALSGGLMPNEDIIAAVTAQTTMLEAFEHNGHLVLRSTVGGSAALLDLEEGRGGALTALGLVPGTSTGDDDIRLSISIPEADHTHGDDHAGGFAHHPYVVVASTTGGVTTVGEAELPFAVDATTTAFLRATALGVLPGFVGELTATEDGRASLTQAQLDTLFPAGVPDELYLAFAVLSEDGASVEFVSNRFTVHFVD